MKKFLSFLLCLFFLTQLHAAVDTFEGQAVTTATDIEGCTNCDMVEGQTVAGGVPSTPTEVQHVDGGDINVASLTIAITPVAGTGRCFIAFGAVDGYAQTVSSATFDGNSMTEITSLGGGGGDVAMFSYCTDTGTSEVNVVITPSSNSSILGWVKQIDGVSKTGTVADVKDFDSTFDDGGGSPNTVTMSVDTTGTDNCLLVSGVSVGHETTTISVCDSTGQTLSETEANATPMKIVGSYFDLSVAGAKDQCFQESITFQDILGITVALEPTP